MPFAKFTNATFAALLCLLTLTASSAQAAQRGPCILGKPHSPKCNLWNGKVTFIGDGDTLNVRYSWQNKKKPGTRIRITGIQAMEEYTYTSDPKKRRGECHANEATARLEYLVKQSKGRGQLAGQHPGSEARDRALRQGGGGVNPRGGRGG